MIDDPIIAELRKFREEYAAKFNYDLAAICRDLREKEQRHERKLVSLPPKPYLPPTLEVADQEFVVVF